MRTAAPTADAPPPAALNVGDPQRPVGQAYRLLRVGFTVLPILFGLDKFASLLTDWTQYLAPLFPGLLGVGERAFMYGVGVVEIAAGILVALKPRYGAYVVAAWLAGIILNLLLLGQFLDVALRDFGLLLGALALARLAVAHAAQTREARAPGDGHAVDAGELREAA
jgi:hypothetical protein